MDNRARSIIFWPEITEDINNTRARCQDCNSGSPSAAIPVVPPSTPFNQIFADYFDCAGSHYLVVEDHLSGWFHVFQSPHGSPKAGANGLVSCLRNFFTRFGVPNEISNGDPEFVAHSTKDFLQRWDVSHRILSAYHAQSNGRAEVAVKSTKRFLWSNTGPSGTLNTHGFLRAMM